MPRSPIILIVTLLLCACGEADSDTPVDSGAVTCESCLESGGTWQPEADECTENCDLMDISCYETSCPGACAADACDNCFHESDCTEVGCTWLQEAEAAWCTAS